MKFVSTRGRAPSVTAAEALVSGLAPDGGLYVPEYLPAPREDWEATADLTYAELAAEVLALFFTDWDKEELLTLCRKAYNGTFNMPGIIRVRKVGEKRYFTELFHGRTLAFKDMALSLFPHLLQAAKEKLGRTETTLILTATSGDTGKAALAGFQDVPGTEIVVFYPEHGVSPVQKWQMQTQAGENVHVSKVILTTRRHSSKRRLKIRTCAPTPRTTAWRFPAPIRSISDVYCRRSCTISAPTRNSSKRARSKKAKRLTCACRPATSAIFWRVTSRNDWACRSRN